MSGLDSMSTDFAVRRIVRRPAAERDRLLADPGFGRVFTDHMIVIEWTGGRGWHDARLEPCGPIVLHPSAQVFHYGQEVFEGLKAYRRADGTVVLFRPYANADRFRLSCERMAMPVLPRETFVEALRILAATDREWVPRRRGHSLYLRPVMFATQPALGLPGRSEEFLFLVLGSPSGAYFGSPLDPITVWISTEFSRAAPGGTGAAKCGGNYAGTILEQERAAQRGCDQVVWLDAAERRWVEEMGTSNIFFGYGSHLVTPPLTGTLMAGINRDSLLVLARDLGYTAEEAPVSLEGWRADAASGKLTEVFASGTSATITPVGHVKELEGQWRIGNGLAGPVTRRLREVLTGIQAGERPDSHGWLVEAG
jgi:branched-chain amino acid aminotransferase